MTWLDELERKWRETITHQGTDCVEADEARTDIPRLIEALRLCEAALEKIGSDKIDMMKLYMSSGSPMDAIDVALKEPGKTAREALQKLEGMGKK